MESPSPSVDRGVDISKIPLICGNLTIRFHIQLPSEHFKLLLSKRRINKRQRDTVERGVPCGEERILPSKSDRQETGDNER